MEVLGSFPADIGLGRSSGLMKKPLDDHVVVIDLEDEMEEEEEWEPESVRSTQMEDIANDEREENVHGTITEVDEKESSFWQEVIALDPTPQRVDGSSRLVDFVDLSSSESGDDRDDDVSDIAEEQEEVVKTLSSEEAGSLAEVMKAIRGGGDSKKFKVESLKTYLRHHGLRIVGLKAVLLSRIQEHLKIQDGRAEEIYPRSSFLIDCTAKVRHAGDVCLGDTVLFRQTIYDTPFDIERRSASGPPLGQRWVAGKVVNESYGAEKQQHTFTIEILWSTGTNPFQVMRPLQIKGRNLYRIQTLRQPWPNEIERQKVLDEKHARGAEAREHRRAMISLKSRGRTKSRQDARMHPYLRSHTPEPHSAPPAVLPQNSVQYGSIHKQNSVYRGSVPATPAPSMQPETHTERAVSQGFTETVSAPEPAVPREWSVHRQPNHHRGFTERKPAPEPTASRGRNFHRQQSRYEGSA